MEARGVEKVQFTDTAEAALVFAQSYAYSLSYHDRDETDDSRFAHFFYLISKHNHPDKQSKIANAFEDFTPFAVNLAYRFFRAPDYTGQQAVVSALNAHLIEEQIKSGAEQVLLLGGFSTYATIHHVDHPQVHFFDVSSHDHFQFKQEALLALQQNQFASKAIESAAAGLQRYAEAAENMHYVNANIVEHDWLHRLSDSGFDPNKKTICIVKGVALYVSMNDLDMFFKQLYDLLNPESQLVAYLYPPQATNARAKLGWKINHKIGAVEQTTLSEVDALEFLSGHQFLATARIPNASIYGALGFDEQRAANCLPKTNIFIARRVKIGDTLPELKDVPAIKLTWNNAKNLVKKI